jgi:hypothetical protein
MVLSGEIVDGKTVSLLLMVAALPDLWDVQEEALAGC